MNTGIHEYRDTGIQGNSDTGMQRDTGMQMDTGMQRDTWIQGYRNTGIQG